MAGEEFTEMRKLRRILLNKEYFKPNRTKREVGQPQG